MALRPLIRPRARVLTPTAAPASNTESLEGLPRVLSRVSECHGNADQPAARTVPRQPTTIAKPLVVSPNAEKSAAKSENRTAAEKPTASKPTLPVFWQSRKVLVAAGILALVSAVAIGYQFRPKQQIIVVHPAKQPATIAASPASNSNPVSMKPAFQPLSPANAPATTTAKETTSTASLMPRATWPAEKMPAAAPAKNPTPPIQTATKPVDTRTSSNRDQNFPVMQERLPQMSSQFPQAASSNPNAAVVYNPTMNQDGSPLASGYAGQNNLPPQYAQQPLYGQQPQYGQMPQNGAQPMYTAARPNIMTPSQPMMPQDGSMGAYGGAHFEGQIQPLPLRR